MYIFLSQDVDCQSIPNTNFSWAVKIPKEAVYKSRRENNGCAFVAVLRFINMRNKVLTIKNYNSVIIILWYIQYYKQNIYNKVTCSSFPLWHKSVWIFSASIHIHYCYNAKIVLWNEPKTLQKFSFCDKETSIWDIFGWTVPLVFVSRSTVFT